MFGFKKTKGNRNIRKKANEDTNEPEHDDTGAADIVRRAAAPAEKFHTSKGPASSNLSFRTDDNVDVISTGKSRSEYEIDRADDQHESQPNEVESRGYSKEELSALASESLHPNIIPVVESAAPYPFSSEGIPDAHEIYMAKQLRRQRQAAGQIEAGVRMEADLDMDLDASNDEGLDRAAYSRGDDGFISLSEGIASSKIRESEDGSPFDDGSIAEGEDEFDTVIIGKNDRAEFNRTVHRAKEESVENAQDEDEYSDWEKEQLRNAGIAPALVSRLKNRSETQSLGIPQDEGGFDHDDALLAFLLGQEKNQLALEQDQLQTALAELAVANDEHSSLEKSIAETQEKWNHFSSLAKQV
ncbi:hypothetical protein GGI02_003936 [Coemansia sp. RSA 2322]|nr:hypothetical protein GGI02_003936 [Coemansia sp. RSA 2322]